MTSLHRPYLTAPPDREELRVELREAVASLLHRNLAHSAKWAAQLLHALPPPAVIEDDDGHDDDDEDDDNSRTDDHLHFRTSTPVKPLAHLQHPVVANLLGPSHLRAGTIRPRDSVGSVMSIGPASSPAVQPELDLDEPMHPHSTSAAAARTTTATASGVASSVRIPKRKREWIKRDELEQDNYALALSLARNHELLRASHTLRRCKGAKARWLRSYTKYLAGEKRAVEDAGEPLGQKDIEPLQNPHAQELLAEMAGWEPGFVEGDGFLLYLKAILLLALPPGPPSVQSRSLPDNASLASHPADDLRLTALDLLVQSVKLEPYNWSAWVKIASCLEGPEELEATMPFLPEGYPLMFFYVHCTLELHSAGDKLHAVLDDLEQVFPGSSTTSNQAAADEYHDEDGDDDIEGEGDRAEGCSVIQGLRALVFYHVRDFDESSAVFDQLQRSDPYRIEDVDILSNILYVSEKRAELAKLAQDYVKIERMRPEVCCLIGNYYSLRRDHEKAIVYFRRALKLDRGYLSAWTLMGHEYIEIKNTNAAIASYRRAVDVNRKDYRAWYGLGQTYELLGESFYALNYYRRATGLRPYDPRMWAALAGCYEKLKRIPDAIQCYQRALVASDPPSSDIDLLLRIGRLYSALPPSRSGEDDRSIRSASYYHRALLVGLDQGMSAVELMKIYLWLARWEMNKERARSKGGIAIKGGDLEKAEGYLRAVEGVQEGKEEAKVLLKELEVLMLSRE
ncbi:anaphase promoting complex subunit CDC23 [Sporobolomyces koalae]|uniref:anaphase promoting complex subunit CDC23 n=1 Tax=Sporobolomyces koalae TaxID=500713 RepID=UPI00317880AE